MKYYVYPRINVRPRGTKKYIILKLVKELLIKQTPVPQGFTEQFLI